jgi:hypothetical protein
VKSLDGATAVDCCFEADAIAAIRSTALSSWTTDESQVRLIDYRLSWEGSAGRE